MIFYIYYLPAPSMGFPRFICPLIKELVIILGKTRILLFVKFDKVMSNN